MAVLHDQVLLEEADGLLRGRGGEADQEGVEVFHHLSPERVDRAVALVDEHHVEGLDGHVRVVGDRHVLADHPLQAEERALLQLRQVGDDLLPSEDRVEPLDRADDDPGDGIDLVGLEVLDVVELGEFPAVVRRRVLLELLERLPAQVGAVHEEEHPPGAAVLDQAIGRGDGGKRLAAPGGHLDEGAGAVLLERALEALDRPALDVPEARRQQLRQVLKPGAEGRGAAVQGMPGRELGRGPEPLGQRLGPVEVEDRPAAGLGIEAVGEAGLDARALIEEGKRVPGAGEMVGHALRVLPRLDLDPRQGGAHLLGLDDARRLAVDVEEVVGEAMSWLQRELADRDTAPSVDIGPGDVLDVPSGRDESGIDRLPGLVLGLLHGSNVLSGDPIRDRDARLVSRSEMRIHQGPKPPGAGPGNAARSAEMPDAAACGPGRTPR